MTLRVLGIASSGIGDSDPAPMFQIIEQPNDFIKESKNTKSADAMNKRQSERIEPDRESRCSG